MCKDGLEREREREREESGHEKRRGRGEDLQKSGESKEVPVLRDTELSFYPQG